MRREEFAKKIHWSFIFWIIGFVNVGAMFPQLWKIISTKNIEGLAIEMFLIYFLVQIVFSAEGYFKRNYTLFVCLGLSALVSAIIIFFILFL